MSQRNGFKGQRHHPYRDRDRERDRDIRDSDVSPRGGGPRPQHRRDSPKGMIDRLPAEQELNRSLPLHSSEAPDVAASPVIIKEKKFTNRARLFIGNLSRTVTEDDFMKLFQPYGEVTQPFIEKERSYGFVRMVRLVMAGWT